jgi:hypothetical protein
MVKPIDILGNKYGRLTVLARDGINHVGKALWLCQCDCGNKKIVVGYDLRSGHTKSCGCLNKEHFGNLNKKHGKSWTPEWKIWVAMKRRCYDQSQQFYNMYGGRGIIVCKKWHDFNNFYNDMGKRPDGMSIERINVNGNYEPSNCKWATAKEQARNTTRNFMVTANNKTQALSAWAEELGLNYYTVRSRIYKLKWNPVEALFGKAA